jgi:hypothetical protein
MTSDEGREYVEMRTAGTSQRLMVMVVMMKGV